MKQVVLALAIGLCFSMSVFADGVVGIEPSVDSNGNSIPAELNGFEYSLKGDQLYIEEYRGDGGIDPPAHKGFCEAEGKD